MLFFLTNRFVTVQLERANSLEAIDIASEVLQGVVMEGFVSNHDRSRSIINISDPDVFIKQSRSRAEECSITK